jgi:hypothetical protein
MIAIEINYNIYNMQMLMIISAVKEWRRYLEDVEYLSLVFSDYKNLKYFTTTKVLNYY